MATSSVASVASRPSLPLQLRRRTASLIAAALITLFAVMLIASVRQESQTFDEANHLYAGLEYWRHADFGHNPEHPPFAKLIAAVPVLPMHLREPAPFPVPFFKVVDNVQACQLLYTADADAILLRGRLAMVAFSLVLALLTFIAARTMFGDLTAVLALAFFVFEPVVLANGALITTDMPVACTFFAAVLCFYRWSTRPTLGRFLLCALCVVLTLAAKHSGVLLLPTLALLAAAEFLLRPREEQNTTSRPARRTYALAIVGLVLIGYLGLWAFYAFRFAARPGNDQIFPNLATYSATLSPQQFRVIQFLARHHLLPEAYLFGWTDILLIPGHRPSFLFGHVFPAGPWYFLPALFLIKTTIPLLALLLLVPFARLDRQHRRELAYMAIPPAVLVVAAVLSGVNLGVRHLLGVYPFCAVLAGAAAAVFVERSSIAWLAVAGALLFAVVSSLHAYPDYLVYSNELFGGPSNTVHLSSDANGDWGQGLKWTRAYLDAHPSAGPCWMTQHNFLVPAAHFGLQCRPLLGGFGHYIGYPVPPIPSHLAGTFLISNTDLTGIYWGPAELNPYATFRDRKPDAQIENDISVFHGEFDLPLLAAENNAALAKTMLQRGQVQQALALAQAAAAQAPDSVNTHLALGQALLAAGQEAQGGQHLAEAQRLVQVHHPEYQRLLFVNQLPPSANSH